MREWNTSSGRLRTWLHVEGGHVMRFIDMKHREMFVILNIIAYFCM